MEAQISDIQNDEAGCKLVDEVNAANQGSGSLGEPHAPVTHTGRPFVRCLLKIPFPGHATNGIGINKKGAFVAAWSQAKGHCKTPKSGPPPADLPPSSGSRCQDLLPEGDPAHSLSTGRAFLAGVPMMTNHNEEKAIPAPAEHPLRTP